MMRYLEFEKRIAEIEENIENAKKSSNSADVSLLLQELSSEIKRAYSNLTAWQIVQIARHPNRPIFTDYLNLIIKDFCELRGDRCFGNDKAIITGFGKIGREKVLVVGHNKGKTTKEKIACHFGMPHPEGFRKALLKMRLAEKFNLPIVTFIDTSGAYPGIGAEERGQAQAIAKNLMEMSRLKVPIISIVISEGGSGGALGIGVCDNLAMLEFAFFSVASPEACASILWKDASKAEEAAEALKLTSQDLLNLKLIDDIIKEPLGGAHRNMRDTAYNVLQYINKSLSRLKKIPIKILLEKRYEKLRSIGS